MAEIETGTVISGTHRHEDLVPALFDELERIDPDRSGKIRNKYQDVLDEAEHLGWDQVREETGYLLEELFDALNDIGIADHGLYFGAHEGDGADFGWWQTEWL